jgi:hypothetical protein
MTQRRITINAYPLVERGPNSFAIAFDFRTKFPSKSFFIETIADCKIALKAFATELEPTGKPWHLSVGFDKNSGRKPAGFDKAAAARELECHVNPQLAPPRAA